MHSDLMQRRCRRTLHTCCCHAPASDGPSRRSLLAAGGILLIAPPTARAADVASLLQSNAVVSNPGASWAVTNKYRQLVYPAWMEGVWQVAAKLEGVTFPQGKRFITKSLPGLLKGSIIMVLPDVGAAQEQPVTYQQRFVKSAAFGGVVADRVFNAQQLIDAFLDYPAVRRVDYDPEANATRMAVVYATPRKDQTVVAEDLRKAEIFINNRSGEEVGNRFLASELYRQVTQASAQGFVGDYEALWEFVHLQSGEIAVRQRVAAFLQPQDAAYFETGGNAVALYDYQCTFSRLEKQSVANVDLSG